MNPASAFPDEALRLLAAGHSVEAAELLRTAPAGFDAHFLLGVALHQSDRREEALDAFCRAGEERPADPQPWLARATILCELDRRGEAAALLRRALVTGFHPDLAAGLATLLEEEGAGDEAETLYRQALAACPDHAAAQQNLGALELARGRAAEALAHFERWAASQPGRADAAFNRAEALLALGRHPEALDAAQSALALDPHHVPAHIDRGLALAALGQVDAGQAAFDEARRLDPGRFAAYRNEQRSSGGGARLDARAIYLSLAYQRLLACDWGDWARYVGEFERRASEAMDGPVPLDDRGLGFASLTAPLSQAARRQLARGIADGVRAGAAGLGSAGPSAVAAGDIPRIAWLSTSFRDDSNGRHDRELLAALGAAGLPVVGYALNPDDGSALRRELAARVACFRAADSMDAAELAAQMRADGIHILVDLVGFGALGRAEVLALRPAPLVLSLLGYPGTLGGLADYLVADAQVAPPGSEGDYDESLLRLPGCHFPRPPLPAALPSVPSRRAAGLPERGVVFGAFHKPAKLEPGVFGLWMRILERVPGAVLWLLDYGPEVRANLGREAAARGVDPHRLVFAPPLRRDAHLARHRLVDVHLDTLVYNGHTTSWEALQSGAPLLGCAGKGLAGRVSSSILLACGLGEFICAGPGDYEEQAVRLGNDAALLGDARARVARRLADPALADAGRVGAHLARAFSLVWQRHRAGLAPDHIDVGADS